VVVFLVSSLVHLYSTEYRAGDAHLSRFLGYLSLFTRFRRVLVTADNFISLFLGWEGVGMCSYLLISFWFTRRQANKAAIKARVVNRVADIAFTVGVLLIFSLFQTLDFNRRFGLVNFFKATQIQCGSFRIPIVNVISLRLLIGAIGKSAQLGLHT